MKINELITVNAVRNMFGKLNGRFVANGFGFEVTAADKDSALHGLISEVGKIVMEHSKRSYAFSTSGNTMFALYFDSGNWCYDIISSDRLAPCSTICSGDYAEALQSMRSHAANYEN